MKVLYAFPENLPMPHARGIQVAHTLGSLLELGLNVVLAYTPDHIQSPPLAHYGITATDRMDLLALSRNPPSILRFLPIRSNRFFNRRLIEWTRIQSRLNTAPDVIMVRHLKTAYALLNAKLKIPVVYEAHEIFSITAKPKLRKKFSEMERLVLKNADRVITISHSLASDIEAHYGIDRQYDVLHSGTEISQKKIKKNWSECRKNIIYTGSLHSWKGVNDLVAAGRWLPGFRIVIIGGNLDQIQHLDRERADDGADINFIAHTDHHHVQTALAEACIAVLPNRLESISAWTSPIKLFEYMGAGCAIVASDLKTVREVLNETEAVLVTPNQPKLLAAAIAELAAAPMRAKEMGERARKKAAAFTWRARGQKLSHILHEAASRNP